MSVDLVTTSLAECEDVIERGLGTFVEVGQALLRIRDERLYRDSHGTFEDYCRERWEFDRSRAYRLIAAAEVAAVVSPIGDIGNEAQARELAGLEPDTARQVFETAIEATGGRPTAASLRAARETVAPRPVKLETTTKTTEFVDPDTGEILDDAAEVITAPQWVAENIREPHPLAAARAEVERQPAVVAGKGIERLNDAVKTFKAAGTTAEIVADLVNDELVDRTDDWLDVLEKSSAVITDLIGALRRSRLRSAK